MYLVPGYSVKGNVYQVEERINNQKIFEVKILNWCLTRLSGWRPRRSIVLCSWGGEEYGLLGSTEWVEVCTTDVLPLNN